MKNIAFISSNLSVGGAEKIAADLSVLLPDSQFNKIYIVFDSDDIEYKYGGKLITLNSKNTNNPFKKLYLIYRRYSLIKKIKRKYNIDTTISHLDSPNFLNILTKGRDRVIITIHSFQSKNIENFYKKFYKYIVRYFFNKADIVVAVAEDIKKDLVHRFKIDSNRIIVIPNSINLPEIEKLRIEPVEKELENIFIGDKTVINVGRLVKPKGQWHLIRAFRLVNHKIPDSKLVIIGEGAFRKYLETVISGLKLEKNVYLLGSKKNPFKYMFRSSVFAFSSIYEGMPVVLLEAMACSKPIVSTNCKSGPSEILAVDNSTDINKPYIGEFGILTPVCDGTFYNSDDPITQEEIFLAESIIQLLENQELRNRFIENSKKRIQDFCPDNIIDKWVRII